jgi:hypothetical protein
MTELIPNLEAIMVYIEEADRNIQMAKYHLAEALKEKK